jgi:hypothetical protein
MRKFFILSVFVALFVSACGNIQIGQTGDRASDAESAQNAMPDLTANGYTSTSASSITDAITAVGGSASLITGNPVVAVAIAKVDAMIQCYQSVGAVDARIYTQANISQILQGELPKVGALAIINRDRVTANLLNCAVSSAQDGLSAQSAGIEPCAGTGTLTRNGETLDYVYAATDPELCTLFVSRLQ